MPPGKSNQNFVCVEKKRVLMEVESISLLRRYVNGTSTTAACCDSRVRDRVYILQKSMTCSDTSTVIDSVNFFKSYLIMMDPERLRERYNNNST